MHISLNNSTAIIAQTISKMAFWKLISNPILALVWVIAFFSTIISSYQFYWQESDAATSFLMTFWLWMTIFFAKLAETLVEYKWLYRSNFCRNNFKESVVRTTSSIDQLHEGKFVPRKKVKASDLILVYPGEIIPFDGILLKGRLHVNEVDHKGQLTMISKSADGDNLLTEGAVSEGDDIVVMQIKHHEHKSLITRLTRLLGAIERQALPSEIALQKIISGLTILFIMVIFTIAVIADYSGINMPVLYILDLIVVLLPTTISGLQQAIVTYGFGILEAKNIIIRDKMVLDKAVDVDVVVLDKTGTLTCGHREMIDFMLLENSFKNTINEILYYSAFNDDTIEGKTIKHFALHAMDHQAPAIDLTIYKFFPFTHYNNISGCDYHNYEIRKGSVNSVCAYLQIDKNDLPAYITSIVNNIATTHGTPMLLTVNKQIIGVIHLRDRVRKHFKKQIEKIQNSGIVTIMVTGDNDKTAGYIAKKLGLHAYHAEITPEKKLDFIRTLQAQGYTVAMYGDGINDAPALAQSDIGISFEGSDKHAIDASNIIIKNHDISVILNIQNICHKMNIKRSSLTVFSLASDIAKYFVIVPALFTIAFPSLATLNFINFYSIKTVLLASLIFNALVILFLTPVVFKNTETEYSNNSLLWFSMITYGISGILSPFIFIKIFDNIIRFMM